MTKVSNEEQSNNANVLLADSSIFVSVGDWLCVCKDLTCDAFDNKKGYTWKGKIFTPHWLKIFDIAVFGGVLCAVVKCHHGLGCNYFGSTKIVPISEFQKQGKKAYGWSKDIDWYFCGARDKIFNCT